MIDHLVDTELAQNKVVCDVPILQTVQDFVRWNAAGALLPYKPESFAALLLPEFREANGEFMDRYMANDARFVQGRVSVARDIAAGKSAVTSMLRFLAYTGPVVNK